MKDEQIRAAFHSKVLRRHHASADTLVVDELGLKHGRCRADIAVVNGHLNGYEIKSDEDSLVRLDGQVDAYSSVFDRVTAIVGKRHVERVQGQVPCWWGLVVCTAGVRGGVRFSTSRRAHMNPRVDPYAVAQLLWRNEAAEILMGRGVAASVLRSRRSVLYEKLVSVMGIDELRWHVRQRLKQRTNWRCPARPSAGGGLSRPSARW